MTFELFNHSIMIQLEPVRGIFKTLQMHSALLVSLELVLTKYETFQPLAAWSGIDTVSETLRHDHSLPLTEFCSKRYTPP